MKIICSAVIIVFLISISASGCRSTENNEPVTEPFPPPSEEPELKLPEYWSYEKETTHEGSRSEGSVGRLFYRYTEIPPVFDIIQIGETIFEYVPGVRLWDNSGYIPAFPEAGESRSDSEMISSTELKRGWYRDEKGKKEGTPGDWVGVKSGTLSFQTAPGRLSELAGAYNLAPPRGGPVLLRSADD